MYFRVDSVDKVDDGLSAQKPLFASAYNTIIYLFLLIKRYNYRYAVICQHVAMVFLIFPNLSTFVNAYFFIKVIGILELICCQRCQPRNVCILFFIVLLVKTKIPHTLVHC